MSYKYITSKSSKNYTKGKDSKAVFGYARKIKGITIHWWGDPKNNPKFDNIVNYLCTNKSQVSAHYVATGTKRQVACIVAPGDVAWHSGNAQGNATTIGIELDPRCRKEDYDVAAELVADIRSAFGDVPIYSHKMWSATACPGKYDIKKIDKLSYTKTSHKTAWGKGGDKVVKTPAPKPAPKPKPAPTPSPKNTDKPDSNDPVAEKIDYSADNNKLLKTILSLLQGLVDKISIIFK